ncbi:MAG: branched-chain amino acid ABC transporter substrate-binding protein [Rhodocyclaceae bacterium]|nr:branched-chain amino acid ABC transporter substrate-binding protein [Rhodocyclaceae bacterium]
MKKHLCPLLLAALFAAPALADRVVKIGFAGPLTGPLAHVGKDEEYGARLALEDANAQGHALAGEKLRFELVAEDDQADPRVATTVAQRLVDGGVVAVVGHVTSGAAIPASRIYHQAGVAVITPSATSPQLTRQNYRETFRLIANDLQQGTAMAQYAQETLQARRIAVIDDRTAYGQGLADAFADQAKARGLDVVGREFTHDKATDFTAILTKLKAPRPDAIFYGGMDAQAAPLLKQMRQLGIPARYLGGDGLCTAQTLQMAGPALDDRVFCTQAGTPMARMPGGAAFKTRFEQRFKTPVQLYAPYAYDAATALVRAVAAAGSADPDKLLAALAGVSFKGITGPVAFDGRGDVRQAGVTLYRYGGGGWQPLP